MDIKLSAPLCFSEIGNKPNQEDAIFPHQEKAACNPHVLLVCDGMGGHENGEVASACVADTIGSVTAAAPVSSVSEMKQVFEKALAKAYRFLDALDVTESSRKMGTTLTFLARCTDGLLIAHIGDSKVFQLRPGEGIVFQTRDHSLVNDLIASGELTEAEARSFPQRNVITRAVQPHQEFPAQATYNIITDVRKGDFFFLCSDGVMEKLCNQELSDILLSEDDVAKRLDNLREECKKRETNDNNSCYCVEVEDVELSSVSEEDEVVLTIAPSNTKTLTSASPSLRTPPSPPHSASSPQGGKRRQSLKESKSNGFYVWLAVTAVICFIIGIILFSTHNADTATKSSIKEYFQGTVRHK